MSAMKALIVVLMTKCVLTLKEVLVALASLLRYGQRIMGVLLVSNSHFYVQCHGRCSFTIYISFV